MYLVFRDEINIVNTKVFNHKQNLFLILNDVAELQYMYFRIFKCVSH